MSVENLAKTAATGALRLVRLPFEIAAGAITGVRRLTDARNAATIHEPPAPEPKPAARKRATPKPKPTAKPRSAKSATSRTRAVKPATGAKQPKTPASRTPAAERPEVVGEQTDGLAEATDRAVEERRTLSS